MPSNKKRINLTVSDELYARIQRHKEKYGITNDAGACLQLIVQQLNGLDNAEAFAKLIKENTLENLMAISNEGLVIMKETLDKKE